MKPPFPSDFVPQGAESLPWHSRVSPDALWRWGMGLFLVSLGVLFVASLVGYVVIVQSQDRQRIEIPPILWFSTFVLLFCGIAIWQMQRAIAALQWKAIRRWVVGAWALSVGFLIVQVPGVWRLGAEHFLAIREMQAGQFLQATDGLVLSLIALHALHVIGGLVPLSWLGYRTLREPMSNQICQALRGCAMYWHFLELMWLIIFATLYFVNANA